MFTPESAEEAIKGFNSDKESLAPDEWLDKINVFTLAGRYFVSHLNPIGLALFRYGCTLEGSYCPPDVDEILTVSGIPLEQSELEAFIRDSEDTEMFFLSINLE